MKSLPSPDHSSAAGSVFFFKGLPETGLLSYFQSQFPEHGQGCGPFSIAMAANLCNNSSAKPGYMGAEIEAELERRGLKIHGFGMPTWLGFRRGLALFAPGKLEYKNHARIQDLEQAIAENNLPLVAIAWQTTLEVLRDLRHASVGHYMVGVGYDLENERIYFLNPGLGPQEGLKALSSWSYREFDKYWNQTWNIFIQPGSMWTISGSV